MNEIDLFLILGGFTRHECLVECSSKQTKTILCLELNLLYHIQNHLRNKMNKLDIFLETSIILFLWFGLTLPKLLRFLSGLGECIRLKLRAWNFLKWKTLWVSLYRRWNISSGLLMEYSPPKRLPTLRPFNNGSTAARDMGPKQME